ncbi:hypothetical protein D3C81_654290 [compost metagenome]
MPALPPAYSAPPPLAIFDSLTALTSTSPAAPALPWMVEPCRVAAVSFFDIATVAEIAPAAAVVWSEDALTPTLRPTLTCSLSFRAVTLTSPASCTLLLNSPAMVVFWISPYATPPASEALPWLLSEPAAVTDNAPLMLTSKVLLIAAISSFTPLPLLSLTTALLMSALVFWRARLTVALPDSAMPNFGCGVCAPCPPCPLPEPNRPLALSKYWVSPALPSLSAFLPMLSSAVTLPSARVLSESRKPGFSAFCFCASASCCCLSCSELLLAIAPAAATAPDKPLLPAVTDNSPVLTWPLALLEPVLKSAGIAPMKACVSVSIC